MNQFSGVQDRAVSEPLSGNVTWSGGRWRSAALSGWRETARAAVLAVLLSGLIAAPGGWLTYRSWVAYDSARMALVPKPWLVEEVRALPARAMVPVDSAAHGRDLFAVSCAACHGAAGTGVPGLGKSLVNSWFVASLDDAELHRFLVRGRPVSDPANTTRVPMPARGGRDDFTDADIRDIVAYVRGLQDPRRLPSLPERVAEKVSPPSADETAKWLDAAGGDAELAEYIASGSKLYGTTCIACHGADLRGIKGNGKDLIASEFARKLDDDALLAFIKKGRDPSDPANTTGVGMPSKGGNPALSDDDLLDIIAYLRTRQTASAQK
ncbi:MAG: c-type cytochrome [Phycisphaerae bacterium]|nr:c-type cytochrome [Phycisphaerae bacterium]